MQNLSSRWKLVVWDVESIQHIFISKRKGCWMLQLLSWTEVQGQKLYKYIYFFFSIWRKLYLAWVSITWEWDNLIFMIDVYLRTRRKYIVQTDLKSSRCLKRTDCVQTRMNVNTIHFRAISVLEQGTRTNATKRCKHAANFNCRPVLVASQSLVNGTLVLWAFMALIFIIGWQDLRAEVYELLPVLGKWWSRSFPVI